jgi:hypothetical protein
MGMRGVQGLLSADAGACSSLETTVTAGDVKSKPATATWASADAGWEARVAVLRGAQALCLKGAVYDVCRTEGLQLV